MRYRNKKQAMMKADEVVRRIREAGVQYAKRYSMKTGNETWKVKLYACDRDIKAKLTKAGIFKYLNHFSIRYKVLDEKRGNGWCPTGFSFWIPMRPRHKK